MNVYQKVTDEILRQLEAGTRPWSRSLKRWQSAGGALALPLRSCGTPYRGINVLMLWSQAMERGYQSAYWLTYKKAQELGGQVRKGERGSTAVFASAFEKPSETPDADPKRIPFMKAYSVFNAEQCDGLPERFYVAAVVPPANKTQVSEAAEAFFAATGANVQHGGDRACYIPALDSIRLPFPDQFHDGEAYAATKAHEFIHWTGAKPRLDRDLSGKFGEEGYAREELVAELGAAFLCAQLRISGEPREDHASYLAAWIKILTNDARAITHAAARAQAACDYLHGLVTPAATEERVAA